MNDKEKTGGAAFPLQYDPYIGHPIHGRIHRNEIGEEVQEGMTLLDYFAVRAMPVVTAEMQETVPASFWDWVKMLLISFLHMNFLEVKFKKVKGVDEVISKKSYELAAAMIEERKKHM